MITQQITDGTTCHSNMGYNYGYNCNDSINDNGLLHVLGGQKDITDAIFTAENDIRTHLNTATNALSNGQTQVNQNVHGVSRDVLQSQHNASKEIGDNKFYTANAISDVRQEIGQNRYQLLQVNNDINKQLCDVKESFNDKFAILLLENQKTEAKTREELLKGFANTQLDACKNASELARQIAECCCETQKALLSQSASIRELELKQSAQTRELALTIENNRLRDKCDNHERHSRGSDIEIAINNVLRNSGK